MSMDQNAEEVVFQDFEDAESLSSNHTEHTDGSFVRVRMGKRRNVIAPLLVSDPNMVRSAELECKRVLKESQDISLLDLCHGYLALGQLAWEKGHIKAALVWYRQGADVVKELFGAEHSDCEKIAKYVTALENGLSRHDFLEHECEEERIVLEQTVQEATVDSTNLYDVVFTISQILEENGMDAELEVFFGDLLAGNFGKLSKAALHDGISILFSRHHARTGNISVALGQAKETLSFAKARGKKSPMVAWVGLEICQIHLLRKDIPSLVQVLGSVSEAIKKAIPESASSVSYIMTLANSTTTTEEINEQLEVLLASMRRSVISLIHPVENEESFEEHVNRISRHVLIGMIAQAAHIDASQNGTQGTGRSVSNSSISGTLPGAGVTPSTPPASSTRRRTSRMSFTRRSSWFRRGQPGTTERQEPTDPLRNKLVRYLAKSFAKAVLHWASPSTQYPVKKLAILLAVHDLTRMWQPSSVVSVAEMQGSHSSISLAGSRSRKSGALNNMASSFAGRSARSTQSAEESSMDKSKHSKSKHKEGGSSSRSLRESRSDRSLGKSSKKDKTSKKHKSRKHKKDKKSHRRRSSGMSSRDSYDDVIMEEDDLQGDTEGNNPVDEDDAPKTFKDILLQFYSKYAPEKVHDVDSIIFNFLGREQALIHTLELKYNVRYTNGLFVPVDKKENMPLDFTLLDNGISYKSILRAFFAQVSPNRVPQVSAILHEYRGRESELVYNLEEKYGVRFHNDGTFTKLPRESKESTATKSSKATTPQVRFHPSLLPPYVTFQSVLETFYRQHCPDKVQDVPAIIEEFKGREATLIHTLQLKYGVRFRKNGVAVAKREAEIAPIDAKRRQWKRVLTAFYSEYAPEKLGDIDNILKRFRGKEKLLLNTLRAKYHVDLTKLGSKHQRDNSDSSNASSQNSVDGEQSNPRLRAIAHNAMGEKQMLQALNEDDEEDIQLSDEDGETQSGLDLRTKLKNSIEAFYEVYYPDKVSQADVILDKFHGREGALLEILEVKYGIRIGQDGVPMPVAGMSSSFDENDVVRESPGGGMVELKTE